MSVRSVAILSGFFLFCSCASIDNAGRIYFEKGGAVKGVEPAGALMARMDKEKELRLIVHGRLKSARIVQCTLLRNQLYVAAIKVSGNDELRQAVTVMENAYQSSDEEFLSACDRTMSTELGKKFLAIQREYIGDQDMR